MKQEIISRLFALLQPHRRLVGLSLLFLFLVSGVQLIQPYLLKVAIDDHIIPGRLEGFHWVALAFLAALIAEFGFMYLQLLIVEKIGQNLIFDLRLKVFSHLQGLSSRYFDQHPVGRLMSRLTSDIDALNEAFTAGVVMMLADLIKIMGIIVILLWMDVRLALVTFSIIPPIVLLTWYFRKKATGAYRRVRKYVAALNGFIQENVSGIQVVQLFGREKEDFEEFKKVNRDHRNAQLDGVTYESMFSAVAEMMGTITIAALLWAGGKSILEGLVTFGLLVAFIEYSRKFFQPLQGLAERFTVMQSAVASAERIFEVLDEKFDLTSPQHPKSLPTREASTIMFDNVTFGYLENDPVIQNVSFEVHPGEKVAIVGWTGSGKSTLIRLLVRLYDVWEGRILIGNTDIRDMSLADLRRHVGIVLQDHFLLADTVEKNISLGLPNITRENTIEAARVVSAHEFIERMPHGYDTEIRERGSNLSMGEKQLISFARAIAFDPQILVLDEATASIDPSTESSVQKGLRTLLEGRTSLVIAHRLSTIEDVDRILVMHKGHLREQGQHDKLLQIPQGIYRALYELQFQEG